MSYTQPAGGAAHFEFVDSAAYTPPAGSAAAFQFAEPALRPFGISSTLFGTPTVSLNFRASLDGFMPTRFGFPSIILDATGFLTGVTFGAPHVGSVGNALAVNATAFGTPTVIFGGLGFLTTNYGLPNSPYPQTGVATGERLTLLPTPRLVQTGNVYAALPSTVIPQAYTAVNQTAVASGSAMAQFGTPIAVVDRRDAVGTIVFANGFVATQFGTSLGAPAQAGVATGSMNTLFGETLYVSPVAAAGFNRTRIGRPKSSMVLNARYATGFVAGATGTPVGALRNRVQSMSIIGAFGTPTVTRSTAC